MVCAAICVENLTTKQNLPSRGVDKLYSAPQFAAMQTHPSYIDRIHSSCRDATERSGIEAGVHVAQAVHWKLPPTHSLSVDHRSMKGKSTNS